MAFSHDTRELKFQQFFVRMRGFIANRSLREDCHSLKLPAWPLDREESFRAAGLAHSKG